MFPLVEKHIGNIRIREADYQETKDLIVQFIFSELYQAENFQTGIRKIPSSYLKRKPQDDSTALDISVEDNLL